MRCFQFIGLKGEAEIWLDENCLKEGWDNCPHCGKTTKTRQKVLSQKHVDSFYTDGPTLHTYVLNSGEKVKEVLQAEPWSSGPMCFLCLELEDGTRICEWSEEEISSYC